MNDVKPTCFQNEKTVYVPRVGVSVRQNSVGIDIPLDDPRVVQAFLEAALIAEERLVDGTGGTLHLRGMDGGVAPGRLVVTVSTKEAQP